MIGADYVSSYQNVGGKSSQGALLFQIIPNIISISVAEPS